MAARLEGKIALVTGGGQGIGRGTCLALAREGAKVVVAGRTEGKCVSVAEEITAFGGIVETVRCDVTSLDDLGAAIDRTVQVFGGLTTLVNNAQTVRNGPLDAATDDDLRVVWESGPLAAMRAMQLAFPHLRAAGDSAIVNFGSSTAVRGAPGFAVYAMAKEAIRGLSRVAAAEWGRYGIRVNVIVPNALSPAAVAFDAAEPGRGAQRRARIPLGRIGDPQQDIGRAVAGLAGADFTYMSGQTLMLTGGE